MVNQDKQRHNLMRALALTAAVVLMASTASAETIAGRASIIDADTLEIHGERIRILDIDAPESRQPCQSIDGAEWRCGQRAALAVSDWIGARPVSCETSKRDRYRRWLAHCTIAGENLAVWIAANGWGIPYRDCACAAVRDAAESAKSKRLGIWSGSFIAPWEWRKQQR
jgi:endonuclease YncB( thermonuclease family)